MCYFYQLNNTILKKSFADFFVVPCQVQKNIAKIPCMPISLKNFLYEDDAYYTFLTYPAVY